jgi:hypothetical protein
MREQTNCHVKKQTPIPPNPTLNWSKSRKTKMNLVNNNPTPQVSMRMQPTSIHAMLENFSLNYDNQS